MSTEADAELPMPPDQAVWRAEEARQALAQRDIAAVYRVLQAAGYSQRRIAALVGQSQSEISEILTGRRVSSYHVLVRIADRLGVPRESMGLSTDPGAAQSSMCRARTPVVVNPLAVQRDQRSGRPHAPTVSVWTGVEIRQFRTAYRMSVREFARHLGVSDRMVSKWEAGAADMRPRPVNQAAPNRRAPC